MTKLKFTIITVIYIITLQSCQSSPSDNKKIFRYNQTVGIETTDPAFAKNQAIMWVVHQLYNTLIEVDENMKLKPSIAHSWEISEDALTFTFHLRSDVYFHQNEIFPHGTRRMTAADVKYSFQRIIDPQTASNGSWIFNEKINGPESFEAPNDTTFVLHLKAPFQPMLNILTMPYCSIVPHEAVDKYGKDFRSHPVGTGPFSLEYWDEGIGMTMVKNLNYFEKDSAGLSLPYIDGISINFVDNKSSEFLMFQQGKIDFMNSIDPSFKDIALYKNGQLKKDFGKGKKLYKTPYLNTEYFGILLDPKSKFAQKPFFYNKFRKAINYAINRQKLIEYYRNGIGVPAGNGIIPSGIPGYDSSAKGYEYNPPLARKLLDECRQEGLHDFDITLSCPDLYVDYASYIISNLNDIGVHAKLDIVQQSLLREQMIKSQCPFFRASWIADYPDAESFLTIFYSGNPAPPNYTRFHNELYDRLYEQALSTTDYDTRIKLYQKLNAIANNEAPMICLYYDEVLNFVSDKITGWKVNPLNMLELRYINWN